jgi:hypothetical protein
LVRSAYIYSEKENNKRKIKAKGNINLAIKLGRKFEQFRLASPVIFKIYENNKNYGFYLIVIFNKRFISRNGWNFKMKNRKLTTYAFKKKGKNLFVKPVKTSKTFKNLIDNLVASLKVSEFFIFGEERYENV